MTHLGSQSEATGKVIPKIDPFYPRVSQFSHSIMSDSLRPHGQQHARLPCPSPMHWACSNSCPSSRWWHPFIWSSVVPFFFCLQSFPASESFPMNPFFASGGQSIGPSTSASVLPMNSQDWFPLRLTGLTLYTGTGAESHLGDRVLGEVEPRIALLLCQASLVAQLVKNPSVAGHPGLTTGSGTSSGVGIGYPLLYSWGSLVKNPPAMWEAWVRSLAWEDPLEEDMAPTALFLPGEFPWTEEPRGLESMVSQRVRHN